MIWRTSCATTPNIQVKRCEPRSVLCVLIIHSLQKLPSAEQVALGTRKSASLLVEAKTYHAKQDQQLLRL